VLLRGLDGEDGASLLDLGQVEAEQPLDRRRRQLAVADRREELDSSHRPCLLRELDRVFPAHLQYALSLRLHLGPPADERH